MSNLISAFVDICWLAYVLFGFFNLNTDFILLTHGVRLNRFSQTKHSPHGSSHSKPLSHSLVCSAHLCFSLSCAQLTSDLQTWSQKKKNPIKGIVEVLFLLCLGVSGEGLGSAFSFSLAWNWGRKSLSGKLPTIYFLLKLFIYLVFLSVWLLRKCRTFVYVFLFCLWDERAEEIDRTELGKYDRKYLPKFSGNPIFHFPLFAVLVWVLRKYDKKFLEFFTIWDPWKLRLC